VQPPASWLGQRRAGAATTLQALVARQGEEAGAARGIQGRQRPCTSVVGVEVHMCSVARVLSGAKILAELRTSRVWARGGACV
jgi:hypothetical protein